MPAHYIPARDSRHRTACFALYRALLRQVPHIVLPAQGTSFPGDRVNPVRHLIRKSFQRNRNEDSARLVVSSLSNGYKFLHLLNGAKTTDSPEHKTVVDLIQRNMSRRKPPTPRKEPTPQAPRKYLITRIPNPRYDPGEWALLETGRESSGETNGETKPARLASQLGGSGIRRVPYVAITAFQDPFLRMKKPQPLSLGMALKRRIEQRQARLDHRVKFKEGGKWMAALEDQWEDLIAGGGRGSGAVDDGEATYVEAIDLSIRFMDHIDEMDQLDQLHRAATLNVIEGRERALAEKEAADRALSEEGAARALTEEAAARALTTEAAARSLKRLMLERRAMLGGHGRGKMSSSKTA
ncbi:hypothetical protein MCOR27_000821 [Pyricularia oryzae]|nr:hypothetical protein MCOR27_000821 [Pyricularia oryzae]